MSDQSTPRILVVDDDTDGLEVLKTRLVHAGYEVETAESAEKALARLKAFDPGLIVTDVRMSGMTGLELLERVRNSMEGVEVVVMTAHDDMQTAVAATLHGRPDGRAEVVLAVPGNAVAPGQACVFYDGDRVLGGGWIAGRRERVSAAA